MDKTIEILKALSDKTRLRLFMSLYEEELCVCQLTDLFELAMSTISKHMSILKHAGLVSCTKKGRWVFYKMTDEIKNNENRRIGSLIVEKLKNEDQILLDRKKLHEMKCSNKLRN